MASADAEIMARMAASVMGGGLATSRRAQPPASAPRSMPTPQFTGSTSVAPLTREQPQPSPTVTITSPPASSTPAATPPTFAPSALPTLTERNMNVTTNAGPQLLGTKDQLEAAREFMQEASKSSTRQPRGGSRAGLSSSRTSVSSASSSRSVTRPSTAQNMLASQRAPPSPAAPMPRLASRPQLPTMGDGWSNFAMSQDRPSATTFTTPTFTQPTPPVAATAPSAAPTPSAFATQPKTDPMDTITNALDKTKITAPATSTPPTTKEDKAAGLFGRQMAGVKSTLTGLTERKTDSVPPHLRKAGASNTAKPTNIANSAAPESKGEAKAPVQPFFSFSPSSSIAETKAEAAIQPTSTFSSNSIVETKTEAQPVTSFLQTKPAAQPATSIFQTKLAAQPTTSTSKSKPMSEKDLMATSAAVMQGTKNDPIVLDEAKEETHEKAINHVTMHGDDVMAALAALKREVMTLTTAVHRLETDKIELIPRMENFEQLEMRRKFFGTDEIKTPFKLDVVYPNKTVLSVQVYAIDKITDLIKSARKAASISKSDNPRIVVDGVQVGHAMMLGEIGIFKGTTKKVAFCYDEPDDEEL